MLAEKELPRGLFRTAKVCPKKLLKLMNERDKAWVEACTHGDNNPNLWKEHEKAATVFRNEYSDWRRKQWQRLCSSMDPTYDPHEISRILESISHGSTPSATNSAIKHPVTGKFCVTDRSRAQAFKIFYAGVCKKPHETRNDRACSIALQKEIDTYIQRADNDKEASPFTMAELRAAIKRLRPKKTPGEDGIHNEYLKHMNQDVRVRILKLANLIWSTGVIPESFLRSIVVPVHKPDKPYNEPSGYRPVALTSCLSKLFERLVVTRLQYILEKKQIISPLQSAFRKGRCTTDDLMRLVSDIHEGFQAFPLQRTVLGQLDFSSAYNRVEHTRLLSIFMELDIPPVFARFYRGFLTNRSFYVRCGDARSKRAKESCGVPQGAVSSPILFTIYMESMIRHLQPNLSKLGVDCFLWADDFILWKTGYSVEHSADCIDSIINDSLLPWCRKYNMLMKADKCCSFLFSSAVGGPAKKEPRPTIKLNGSVLRHGTKKNSSFVKILGVLLDRGLTFTHHIKKLSGDANKRVYDLARIANCQYGMSQANLRTVYITHVRSLLEYAAPAWYPSLTPTQLNKLQIIQNKALRVVLGVKRCTNITALHLEANVVPLEDRYIVQTAYMAEKFRRFPTNDPLYHTAHKQLPPLRLKRKSWQYLSDEFLFSNNINPSRLDGRLTAPTDGQITLYNRQPLCFYSSVCPWELDGIDRIHIIP
jgi:hypothetical protein